MNINVQVKNKIATLTSDIKIVCGNSDYVVTFSFDSEWDSYSTKTARFITDSGYQEVAFTGNQCAMPMINNTLGVRVGVYTGTSATAAALHTTTPACIDCVKSILCGGGTHISPTADVYAQILALLNGFSASASKTGDTATITIVDPNGTTTATIKDGAKGDKGDKGDTGEAGTTSWNGITDRPTTFPPSAHNHDDRYFTETEVNALIAAITALIPIQASASNQLADKNFTNSSIATNTAYYVSNNGQPFTSVAQLEAYTGTVTNNDYAIVTGTDEQGNTYFDRYKARVENSTITWAKEYRLNNSSFTAIQWAAISSGITAALVASYNSHLSNINNPHNVTKSQVGLGSVDNTSDADKPVSNAMQNALDNKVDKVTGKGLSSNDYTNEEKTKLAGLEQKSTYQLIETITLSEDAIVERSNLVYKGIRLYFKVPTSTSGCGVTARLNTVQSAFYVMQTTLLSGGSYFTVEMNCDNGILTSYGIKPTGVLGRTSSIEIKPNANNFLCDYITFFGTTTLPSGTVITVYARS